MARGWESKSVEEQISARQTEFSERRKPPLTPSEMQRLRRLEGLRLARIHTENALHAARDAGRRSMLEQALADLDAQIAELSGRPTPPARP